MDAQALTGGFDNAPIQSAQAFRAVMNVMARPGQIEALTGAAPPAELSAAAGTLLLTLCDPETPVHLSGPLDCAAVRDWLTFHTGAPFTEPQNATFAVGDWQSLLPITRFRIGTAQYPDRSTSLIVELPELSATGATLRGPGIKDTAHLSLPDILPFQLNAALFPQGCDFYFTHADRIAALPRTTQVEDAPCM